MSAQDRQGAASAETWKANYNDMPGVTVLQGGIRVAIGFDANGKRTFAIRGDGVEEMNGFELVGILEGIKSDVLALHTAGNVDHRREQW